MSSKKEAEVIIRHRRLLMVKKQLGKGDFIYKPGNPRHKEGWIYWFKHIYGETPICEICGKELFWKHKDHSKRVHFDHKNGGIEDIKRSPSYWIIRKKSTYENLLIFIGCNFGILCNRCNLMLPTKNRRIWLINVTNYMSGCSTFKSKTIKDIVKYKK